MSERPKFYLETERCRLRGWTEADLPNLVKLDSDPEVMFHINGGKPTSLEDMHIRVLPAVWAHEKRYGGELGNWIVEDRNSGEFMGWFHLRPDKKNLEDRSRLELGYRLKRESWGKGIATEVSNALIQQAWRLGAKEVFARAHQENRRSIRIMEKVGMILQEAYIEAELVQIDKRAVKYSLMNPAMNR